MQETEFIDKVRRRLHLRDATLAQRAVKATLATLGQCIEKTHRDKLAAPLPPPLKDALRTYPETDRFDLEEFYNRVSARSELGYPEAVEGSHAVCAVLKEAVGTAEIEMTLSKIPAEFKELFSGQPQSALSPTNHKPGRFR